MPWPRWRACTAIQVISLTASKWWATVRKPTTWPSRTATSPSLARTASAHSRRPSGSPKW